MLGLLAITLYGGLASMYAVYFATLPMCRSAPVPASLRWVVAAIVALAWPLLGIWALISVLTDRAKRATRAM